MKKNILCVHSGDAPLRGSEHRLLDGLKSLQEHDRNVLLLCDQPTMLEAATRQGIRARQIPYGEIMIDPPGWKVHPIKLLKSNHAVYRHAKEHRAQTIYCNGGRAAQMSYLASKASGLPLVAHMRSPYNRRYFLLYGLTRVDAVIHCAHAIKVHNDNKAKLRRSIAIWDSLDFEAIERSTPLTQAEIARYPELPPGIPVLGFIASLIRRKGLDLLIDAVDQLRKQGREVALLIAGQEQDDTYRRQVNSLGLQSHIFFLGEITDRKEFFSRINIHVLPTRSDALPGTPIEAAYFGVRSLVTDVGGLNESILNGKLGCICAPESSTALAEKLEEMIDGGLWMSRPAELRNHVLENFSAPAITRQLLAVIDSV